MGRQEAREIVALSATSPIVQIDPAMIQLASHLEEQQQLSSRDALSLEAAVRAGATHLVTERASLNAPLRFQ
jgi:predicted nucleic acid-binding protein